MRRVLVQMGPFVAWSLASTLVGGLLVGVLGGRTAAAPKEEAAYKTYESEITVDLKDKKKLGDAIKKRNQFASGTLPLSGKEPEFDDTYNKFVFPSWTLTSEEHLGKLGDERVKFLRDDLGRSPQPVHDRLVDLTFNYMKRIAADTELHPGVRYNAVLVLGALNTKEPDKINKTNPEPLPKALDELVGLYTKADESDAVRLAALLGILRHLEWDEFRQQQASRMAAGKKAAIVSELVALAQMTTPPAGRSLDGHTWMRRRAVEGLMYATLAELTPEIAGIIEKLVSANAEPLSLRCTAADIMGRVDYKDPVKPAAEPNALELGYLALVACDAELTRLDSEISQQASRSQSQSRLGPIGAGGAGMPGGVGGAMPPGAAGGMMGGMMGKMMGTKPGGAPAAPGKMGGMMGGMMGGKTKPKTPKNKSKNDATALPDLLTPSKGTDILKPADPNAQRLESLRRRLRAWLYAVQMGLGDEKANLANRKTGFGAKATETYTRGVVAYTRNDDERKYVKEVIAQVQELIKVVEDPGLDHEAFTENLRTQMKALEKITKPLAPPATEAAEPADGVPGPAAAKAGSGVPAAKGAEVPVEEVPTAPAAAPMNPPAATPEAVPAAEAAKGAAPAPATKSP